MDKGRARAWFILNIVLFLLCLSLSLSQAEFYKLNLNFQLIGILGGVTLIFAFLQFFWPKSRWYIFGSVMTATLGFCFYSLGWLFYAHFSSFNSEVVVRNMENFFTIILGILVYLFWVGAIGFSASFFPPKVFKWNWYNGA